MIDFIDQLVGSTGALFVVNAIGWHGWRAFSLEVILIKRCKKKPEFLNHYVTLFTCIRTTFHFLTFRMLVSIFPSNHEPYPFLSDKIPNFSRNNINR